MSITTCPSRAELSDYLAGRLADGPSETIAGHLDACPTCQAALAAPDGGEDPFVAGLQGPLPRDPYLQESQCHEAVARARAVLDPPSGPTEPSRNAVGGKTLGEYQLIAELGHGGMGTVYKALHTKLGRVVAVKVLALGRLHDHDAAARFEREMQAVGQLDHRHIVRAYDAREIDGTPTLVMEYLQGLDLGEIVRRLGPLPPAEACELARQTAVGLQTIHEHGLVHRDIKPSNLMLVSPPLRAPTEGGSGEGRGESIIKILDLGLARLHLEQRPEEEMTGTGRGMGTADYMAPEQGANSRDVDIRADIYSLGCTLYKLLSGQVPFGGPEHRGTLEKLKAHVHEPAPPIRRLVPDVPEGLAALVDRLLAKEPGERFATPAEVAEALAAWCAGADLPALLRRAIEAEQKPETAENRQSPPPRAAETAARPPLLLTSWGWKWFAGQLVLLLMAGGLGFVLGIMIRIHKDGQETTVDVPVGSSARVNADGQVDVTLPGQATPAGQTRQPEEPPLRFGPVIERVVNAVAEGKGSEGLDLLGGKLVDLPKEFAQWSAQQQDKWCAENNVDLVVDLITSVVGGPIKSLALAPQGVKLAVAWDGWDIATAKKLHAALMSVTPEQAFNPLNISCSVTVSERHGVTYYMLFGVEPSTFVFQTRKGDLGILQVMRLTEEPRGMRIRYKLVQPSAAIPAVSPAAELKALQGQWKVVRVEKGADADKSWGAICGYVSAIDPATTNRLGFAEDPAPTFYVIRRRPAVPSGPFAATPSWEIQGFDYRLDPTASPKSIDLLGSPPPPNWPGGPVALGIYEIQGDQLKIRLTRRVLALPEQAQRPKQFSIEPNSGDVLFVLERDRRAAEGGPPPMVQPSAATPAVSPAAELTALQGPWEVVRVEKGKAAADRILTESNGSSGLAPAGISRLEFSPLDCTVFDLDSGQQVRYAYRIDPGAAPKTIDFLSRPHKAEGRASGLVAPGLYEIQGDQLRICLTSCPPAAISGDQRPKRLALDPASGDLLFVLQRCAPSQEEQLLIGSWAVETQVDDGRPVAAEKVHEEKTLYEFHSLTSLWFSEATGGSTRQCHLAALVVDAAKKPPRITIHMNPLLQPFEKPGILRGIYKLDGDRLQLACRVDGPAPEKFLSTPGSGVTLLVLKRSTESLMGGGSSRRAPRPPVVAVVRPVVREISDYEDFTGLIQAVRTVEIRAQVSGVLEKVHFQAGTIVKPGDLLFEIDPRASQAELAKREADVRVAQLRVSRLTIEAKSAKLAPLVERDRTAAELVEAQAAVQAAQEGVNVAKLNLERTKLTVPLGGKIGRPLLDPGNLVTAGSTPLAKITSQGPMYVEFFVDERLHRAGPGMAQRDAALTVLCGLAGEEGFPHRGQIEFRDSEVDAAGQCRWRALLPNPDGLLVPGMAARVRLITSAPHQALLVPKQALTTDQGKPVVLIVNDHNVVERRAVKVGQNVDDGLRVVTEGLTAQDWVIRAPWTAPVGATGLPGMTVQPERAAMPASPAPPAKARPMPPPGQPPAAHSSQSPLRPAVKVVVQYADAPPSVIEDIVAAPLFQNLIGMEGPAGASAVTCVSSVGQCAVYVQGQAGGDAAALVDRVEERIQRALSMLPPGSKPGKVTAVSGEPIPPELEIHEIACPWANIDRAKAAKLGVSLDAVLAAIRSANAARKPLSELQFETSRGGKVPLSDFAEIKTVREPSHRILRAPLGQPTRTAPPVRHKTSPAETPGRPR